MFKKTKEEMIKYIIRRTYHNAKQRKNTNYRLDFEKIEPIHERYTWDK
jgi:hypothetical protein